MVAKSGGLKGPGIKRPTLMMQLSSVEGPGLEGLSVAMATAMAEDTMIEAVGMIASVLTVLMITMGIHAGIWHLVKMFRQWAFTSEKPKLCGGRYPDR